jgi:flavin reductase (DIM6/NTAB) family NADH-FMN oxidoreductase RutF
VNRLFYTTDENRHGLAHDPFKAIVSPRPIGWIGTKSVGGARNLGPYSFFNALSDRPKLVMFSSQGLKHSAKNAIETGVFTASLVSLELADQMNASSVDAPEGVDEFGHAGIEAADGKMVDAPYVEAAYAVLECRVTESFCPKGLDGGDSENHVVIGQVVGIHIRDEAIRDGRLDMAKVAPLARMGYMDYTDAAETFEMFRPKWQG